MKKKVAENSKQELAGKALLNMDWRGINLRDVNLSGANLSQSDLRDANFRESDLTNATLTGVKADEAEFFEADMKNVQCYEASFVRADLSEVNMTCAVFSHVDFRGADFYGANLYTSSLSGSDLRGANLKGVDLRGSNLLNTKGVMGIAMEPYAIFISEYGVQVGCEYFTPVSILQITAEKALYRYCVGRKVYNKYRHLFLQAIKAYFDYPQSWSISKVIKTLEARDAYHR